MNILKKLFAPKPPVDIFAERRKIAIKFLAKLKPEEYDPETYGSPTAPKCLIGWMPHMFPTEFVWGGFEPYWLKKPDLAPFRSTSEFLGLPPTPTASRIFFLPKEELIQVLINTRTSNDLPQTS